MNRKRVINVPVTIGNINSFFELSVSLEAEVLLIAETVSFTPQATECHSHDSNDG